MQEIDWSRFSVQIPVNAGVQQVYDLWTSANGLESWFLRKAEFINSDGEVRNAAHKIEAGDTYNWYWHGYPDSDSEHGKIVEANGTDRLKFVFGKAGVVTVTIKTIDDETLITLSQEQIPLDDQSKLNFHVGCSNGWTFYLANLKSILEGGLDLRNRNLNITGVINS